MKKSKVILLFLFLWLGYFIYNIVHLNYIFLWGKNWIFKKEPKFLQNLCLDKIEKVIGFCELNNRECRKKILWTGLCEKTWSHCYDWWAGIQMSWKEGWVYELVRNCIDYSINSNLSTIWSDKIFIEYMKQEFSIVPIYCFKDEDCNYPLGSCKSNMCGKTVAF